MSVGLIVGTIFHFPGIKQTSQDHSIPVLGVCFSRALQKVAKKFQLQQNYRENTMVERGENRVLDTVIERVWLSD